MHESARAVVAHAREPWLGRFVDTRMLPHDSGIERRAARDAETGAPRLVLATTGASCARLNEAARVLELLDHAHVPKVIDRGLAGSVAWLALDCEVAGDLDSVFRSQASQRHKLSVAASWALAERWLDVLAHAHQRVDPVHARPICLGSFTWSNVLVTPEGVAVFVGFGDDLWSEPGQLSTHVVRAPELGAGAEAWPGGDLWALLTLFHSLLPLRELPPPIARVMRGAATDADAEVHTRLRRLHASILCEPEDRTRDALCMQARYRALWQELGISADSEALAAFVRQGLTALGSQASGQRAALHALPDLEIEPDARAFRVRGASRVDLTARHVARRLLAAFVDAEGRALSTHELVAAGWPGERMRTEAGVHRVHVALHQLRRLGLQGLLAHGEHGYRLACSVALSSSA